MGNNIFFVQRSLELHLFFSRIMKEHSLFLELGFMPRDGNFTSQADRLRRQFDAFLFDVVDVARGAVSRRVLQSGEVVTPYTLDAERLTSFYTGVDIPTEITRREMALTGNGRDFDIERHVFQLNARAMQLIEQIIRFKQTVISNVLNCSMFTVNYPLLIEHILREAQLYLELTRALQQGTYTDEMAEDIQFWNRIMAEHSMFIRGLLDPTEKELINAANGFANEFEALLAMSPARLREESLNATRRLRDFKETGTKGIIDCDIRSIILPLLGDHVLREANHFIRLLRS